LRELGVQHVYVTPIADDPSWRSIQLAVEVCRIHEVDILHAHMPKSHVLAGIAGCLVHKPVVATVHGMHVTAHELGVTRAVGSHLITNCQEAYIQALAMGLPSERVAHIRNGIDTNLFTPGESKQAFRKSLKVPERSPLLGFVGRLEEEKGPDLFLQAAEYIHYKRPDVHFLIAGEGSMKKQLKKLCMQMRLQQHMHFVGWSTDTLQVYQGLDILVHTSRSDGTSLVLLEAMSCGCPVAGLAVGGVREIIENESTGTLAEAGDCQELGKQIIKLLEEPVALQAMGAAARLRVQNHFNVETNTRRAAEILRDVASKGMNRQQLVINSSGLQEMSVKKN